MKQRPPKKTETLEVRLPHTVKQAFMARTHAQGRAASAVIREFIEVYLADPSTTESRPAFQRLAKPLAATSIAASALALYALTPIAAAAAPDLRVLFDDLDRNRDGLLSAAEFVDRDSGGPGRLEAVDAVFARSPARVNQGATPHLLLVRAGVAALPSGPLPAEVRANLRRPFDAQDTDRNSTVTFAEFETYHVAVLRQGFDALDGDRNGTLERSEYVSQMRAPSAGPAALTPSFDHADRNGDGRIAWGEFLS